MRKRLALAGLIILMMGILVWFFFMSIPTAGSMPSEAALGWLILFPIIAVGSLLLGVTGLVVMILRLVLKAKPSG